MIDESGIFLSPLVRRTWSERGRTPILKTPGRKRQKVSLISALSVSPRRGRLGLYFRTFPDAHITQVEAASFVRGLLRHLKGRVILVWDRGTAHKGASIRRLLHNYPRLETHWLPPYAPELNPTEHVWNHLKYGTLANFTPLSVSELNGRASHTLERARNNQERLRSFFKAAKLDLDPRTLAA